MTGAATVALPSPNGSLLREAATRAAELSLAAEQDPAVAALAELADRLDTVRRIALTDPLRLWADASPGSKPAAPTGSPLGPRLADAAEPVLDYQNAVNTRVTDQDTT
jgi:hypothetical protein